MKIEVSRVLKIHLLCLCVISEFSCLWISKHFYSLLKFLLLYMVNRGWVEDTKIEAKAKDTKKSEAKAKDSLSEDRHSRGQGQECSRPRPRTKDTSASALQKKKKVFTKIFQAVSTKKRFPKNFSRAPQNFNIPKNSAVLEPRTGQFSRTWGLEAKAKDFKICPRGQGRPRGLHLWWWMKWQSKQF